MSTTETATPIGIANVSDQASVLDDVLLTVLLHSSRTSGMCLSMADLESIGSLGLTKAI